MENASKALIMAGGVLIAIIILSMFVMMYNKVSGIKRTQQEKVQMEQIASFNAEYEAFNKKMMYGTDIITIINKAIQNNKNMQVQIPRDRYYINIKIKTNSTFQSKIEIKDLEDEAKDIKLLTGRDAVEEASMFGVNISDMTLNKGEIYSLGDWRTDELNMKSDIIKFFQSDTEDMVKQTTIKNKRYIYNIYSALTTFKTSLFKCTNVEYDDEGRIKEMQFEQR